MTTMILSRRAVNPNDFFRACILSASLGLALTAGAAPTALDEYVNKNDGKFAWKVADTHAAGGFTATRIELTSQQWQEHLWTHQLLVVRPDKVRNPDIGFMFITGGSSTSRKPDLAKGLSEPTGNLALLKALATQAGAVAAAVTQVPNQPLYDGRKEDALIAYTFEQFSKTGDSSWPLLLPMAKSAVRAMDAVQAFAKEKLDQDIQRWVVGGASKRGWTTWLTGASDKRVVAIAPMVIDMLNMKKQIDWAEKVYGKQSEQIADYTDLNLHLRMDEPRIVALRDLVDPYSYRDRYTMPKLLLLGTNDRYWTVDSLRHYWSDLPEPKLIFQTANAGHDLGGGQEATKTLSSFFQIIADRQPLPKVQWQFQPSQSKEVSVTVKTDQKAKSIHLWTADSADRDFRDESWKRQELQVQSGSSQAQTAVSAPNKGYRAYLGEIVITSPTGQDYKLSTEARVTPDTQP